jgi:hypothetical protein
MSGLASGLRLQNPTAIGKEEKTSTLKLLPS